MAIPFYGDVVGYLVSLRDVYLETLAAERDADALAAKEAEEECSEPTVGEFAFGYNEALPLPNCGGPGCDGGCCKPSDIGELKDFFRSGGQTYETGPRPKLSVPPGPSITSPAAQPAVVDEDSPEEVAAPLSPSSGEFPTSVTGSGAPCACGHPLHYGNICLACGCNNVRIPSAPSEANPGEFAAVAVREVLADHAFLPDPMHTQEYETKGACLCDPARLCWESDWRDHVAEEVSRRINAAAADRRVTERLDAVPDRFRRWFEPEGKK
jgi:hypothetical protein